MRRDDNVVGINSDVGGVAAKPRRQAATHESISLGTAPRVPILVDDVATTCVREVLNVFDTHKSTHDHNRIQSITAS